MSEEPSPPNHPAQSPSWVTFVHGSPENTTTQTQRPTPQNLQEGFSYPVTNTDLSRFESSLGRRPITPRLSTSNLNYASISSTSSTLSLAQNDQIASDGSRPRPTLGRSVTSPMISPNPTSSPRSRKRVSATGGGRPARAEREWSLFGQLMENEGQLPSPKTSTLRRSTRRGQHGQNMSGDVTPRESVVQSMEESYASVDVQSPVVEEELFRNSTAYSYSSDFDSSDSSPDSGDSDSDVSTTTAGITPASVYGGPPPPPSAPTITEPPLRWYSPKRLPTVPLLYRNIFKCALAYFIASLFTFSPYLSGFISDLVSRGKGGGKPLPSGHMVATVAVYFNPAKTMGGMMEADVFCMFGLVYASAVCLSCMSVFWWLEQKPGLEWVGDIFAIVWVGISMSLLAWLKVWMANPQFNTACSMMAIILFVVLVKEGGLHTLLQVCSIVLTGSIVSNLVCYLIWPTTATQNLQSNMVKTLDSFSTLLSMLTETFLLEPGAISNHRNSQGKIQRAVEAHQGSFTGLKKSLKEAKSEWFLWGRMRRPDWKTLPGREARWRESLMNQDGSYGTLDVGSGEDHMKGKGRRRAYEDAVDSLNRLGQHLNGLRSGTRLQYELTKAGIVDMGFGKGKGDGQGKGKGGAGAGAGAGAHVSKKINGNEDTVQSARFSQTHPNSATTKTGLLVDVSIAEEDDEETAILKTAAAMFGDLVDDLGPPLKALAATCAHSLKRLREAFVHAHSDVHHHHHRPGSRRRDSQRKSQKPEFTLEEFTQLIDGIQKALRRFESTSNHALLRLYRKSDLSEQLKEHLFSAHGSSGPGHGGAGAGQYRDEPRPHSAISTAPSTMPSTPGGGGGGSYRRHRSGTVLSSSRMSYRESVHDTNNRFLSGPDNEHVFLVYFFIFTLQEFAEELVLLVDAMERIYAIEQQRLTWRRWWSKLWDATRRKTYGLWSAWRVKKYTGNGRPSRKGGLRRKLSNYVTRREKRGPRPVFPKVKPHAPDTIQTPSRRELSFVGKTKQLIWTVGKRMSERDIKYAIKAGMATALLAAPAFFDVTRPFVLEYNVDWALISFFVVMSPTIGATNFLGLHRVFGTLFGAAVAAGIYTLFPDNAPVLAIFGFFFSIPCFYYLVAFPQYASSARFVLLTYNLTCLYCYNKRERDLAVTIIATHRAIAVTAGVVWAAVVSRFWWPAEARRELSKALGEFCLNLGWLYTRLVAHNSFAVEYKDNDSRDSHDSHDSEPATPSDEHAPLISQHQQQLYKLNNSIHEFMAMELHLQIKLIELQGLLAQTQHEPRLKGPFPVKLYRGILTSLQTILDKLHSMRCVTTKEEWFTNVRQDFIIPVSKERREMVGNIILFFSTLASAFRLKAPLPPYLPPAEEARLRLVDAIRSLEVVRNRDVKGSRQLLFFAYALTMKGVTIELKNLGRTLQEAFGVIGQTPEEFEALFVTDTEDNRRRIDDAA